MEKERQACFRNLLTRPVDYGCAAQTEGGSVTDDRDCIGYGKMGAEEYQGVAYARGRAIDTSRHTVPQAFTKVTPNESHLHRSTH